MYYLDEFCGDVYEARDEKVFSIVTGDYLPEMTTGGIQHLRGYTSKREALMDCASFVESTQSYHKQASQRWGSFLVQVKSAIAKEKNNG